MAGFDERLLNGMGVFAAIVDALKAAKNDYWATEVEVQRLGAAAWIAFAEGNRAEALDLMRQSAEMEDASEKNAVPKWVKRNSAA